MKFIAFSASYILALLCLAQSIHAQQKGDPKFSWITEHKGQIFANSERTMVILDEQLQLKHLIRTGNEGDTFWKNQRMFISKSGPDGVYVLSDSLVLHVDPESLIMKPVFSGNPRVSWLTFDVSKRSGAIWIASGLPMVGADVAHFSQGKLTKYTEADGLFDTDYKGLVIDQNDRPWLLSREKIVSFDGKTFNEIHQSDFPAFSNWRYLFALNEGSILAFSDSGKYVQIDTQGRIAYNNANMIGVSKVLYLTAHNRFLLLRESAIYDWMPGKEPRFLTRLNTQETVLNMIAFDADLIYLTKEGIQKEEEFLSQFKYRCLR